MCVEHYSLMNRETDETEAQKTRKGRQTARGQRLRNPEGTVAKKSIKETERRIENKMRKWSLSISPF